MASPTYFSTVPPCSVISTLITERVTQEAPRALRPKPDRGIRRTHDVDEEASDQPDFTVGVHVASIVACGWRRFYMLVTPRV